MHVIRAGWLDRLWTECAAPRDFWVKGSAVRGHRANAFASSQPDAAQRDALLRWLGHVNGCALYDLSSPDFAALVRTTLDRHNPGTGWRPFDVALWRVLFYAEALLSGPGSPGPDWDWERDYARFAHKVCVYSDGSMAAAAGGARWWVVGRRQRPPPPWCRRAFGLGLRPPPQRLHPRPQLRLRPRLRVRLRLRELWRGARSHSRRNAHLTPLLLAGTIQRLHPKLVRRILPFSGGGRAGICAGHIFYPRRGPPGIARRAADA